MIDQKSSGTRARTGQERLRPFSKVQTLIELWICDDGGTERMFEKRFCVVALLHFDGEPVSSWIKASSKQMQAEAGGGNHRPTWSPTVYRNGLELLLIQRTSIQRRLNLVEYTLCNISYQNDFVRPCGPRSDISEVQTWRMYNSRRWRRTRLLQVSGCDDSPHFLILPEGSGISFTEAFYGCLQFPRHRLGFGCVG